MASNNKFKFEGLEELKTALRNLPTDLRNEAAAIVPRKAFEAKAEIIAAYHERSGRLKRGVTSEEQHSAFGIAVIVKSRSRLAWLYDHGSQARHTDLGANRGSMPAQPTFIPIAARKRREMFEELVEMLRRQGLTVVGTP